jgi:hypothetical protein
MRVNGTELGAAEAAFGKRFEMAWLAKPTTTGTATT